MCFCNLAIKEVTSSQDKKKKKPPSFDLPFYVSHPQIEFCIIDRAEQEVSKVQKQFDLEPKWVAYTQKKTATAVIISYPTTNKSEREMSFLRYFNNSFP